MPIRFAPRLRRAAAAMVLLCSVAARGHVSFAQGQPNAVLTDGVAQLLLKIEAAVGAGSASDFLALSTLDPDDPNVRAFLDRWLVARTTRATVHERDRLPLDGGGVRLMAEALIEAGSEGRLATWTLEMAPAPDGTWRLTESHHVGHRGRPVPPRARSDASVPRARPGGPGRGFRVAPARRRRVRRHGRRADQRRRAHGPRRRWPSVRRPTPSGGRSSCTAGREALTTRFRLRVPPTEPGRGPDATARRAAHAVERGQEHVVPGPRGVRRAASEVVRRRARGSEPPAVVARADAGRLPRGSRHREVTARSPTPTPTTIRKTSPSSIASTIATSRSTRRPRAGPRRARSTTKTTPPSTTCRTTRWTTRSSRSASGWRGAPRLKIRVRAYALQRADIQAGRAALRAIGDERQVRTAAGAARARAERRRR